MTPDRYREAEQKSWTSLGLHPNERDLQLDRLGTKARVLELGEGPPILFVHGAKAAG